MAHEATATLRELIVMGAIPPGTPLRLEEIARYLDMSISPVRDAVRQLEALGLAEHLPYQGARVTPLDAHEMHDVYEVRVALERISARRAAERSRTGGTLLDGALRDLAEAYPSGERARIVHGNTAFHAALSEASGSRWLARLLRPMLETSERFGAALILDEHAADVYAVEAEGHREIVCRLPGADPDGAEEALCRHLAVFEALFEEGVEAYGQG